MTEGYTPFPQEELPADLPTIIVYGVDKSLYTPKRWEPGLPRELPPEKEIFKPPAEEVLPPKITYIPVPSVYEVPPEGRAYNLGKNWNLFSKCRRELFGLCRSTRGKKIAIRNPTGTA